MSIKRLVVIVVLVVGVGVPVGLSIWGNVEQHRFRITMDRLHAAGEPITPDQLPADSLPDDQNASLDYQAAAHLVATTRPSWKSFDLSTDGSYLYPPSDKARKNIGLIVTENNAALLRAASARGKQSGSWHDPFNAPTITIFAKLDFGSVRDLANLLWLESMDAHLRGDDRQALNSLTDLLALADASEKRPTLIAHLVADGIVNLAGTGIAILSPDITVDKNGATRSQITALILLLQDEKPMQTGTALAWRTERMAVLETMENLLDGKWSDPAQNSTGNPAPADLAKLRLLMAPIVYNDARLSAEHFQGVMQAASAPDWPAAQHQMPTALPTLINSHRYYHLLAGILIPNFKNAVETEYGAKSVRRLAAVALAARLFAADHGGQLPRSLKDLSPMYLPGIPIDPMSGHPLLYKSDPPRFYSIGGDGVDHGGTPVDPDKPTHGHRVYGDTVVYLQTQPRKPATQP
jgi:hypothetical protein